MLSLDVITSPIPEIPPAAESQTVLLLILTILSPTLFLQRPTKDKLLAHLVCDHAYSICHPQKTKQIPETFTGNSFGNLPYGDIIFFSLSMLKCNFPHFLYNYCQSNH